VRSKLLTGGLTAAVVFLLATHPVVVDAAGRITGADIKNNSVASKDIKNGTVQSRDVKDGGLTGADLADGSVTGADIQDNAIGSADVADFALTNQDIGVLYAEVSVSGSLQSSSGGVVSTKVDGFTGAYEVDFGRDVSACASFATLGVAGATAGEVLTADRAGDGDAVFVQTANSAGNAADRPFRVLVVC
jgi:hypothetical protein